MLLKSTLKICADFLFPTQNGNKSSVKTSAQCNYFYSRLFLLIALPFFCINSYAQFDPRIDCTNGCTSNDVQIKTAYLVDPATHVALSSNFQCQGAADVRLALDLTTKTPRVGVYIYARIVNKLTLQELEIVSECFSTPLASNGVTKVVFNEAINWPCGTPIVLKDVFIGWGTGNTDFCANSSAERCPATPSKCYSLPPGEYITVIVPSALPATATLCSDAQGGTTATFDLTALNSTVSGGASGVTVTWYSDLLLTTVINTPGAYVSASGNVFAKVSNNLDPTAFESTTVGLTVNRTPVANAASATLCSSVAGGAMASFNLTALESTIINGQQNVAISWYSDAGLTTVISTPADYISTTGTVYAKATNTAATTCFSSVAVPLTVSRIPTVSAASATLCSTSPGGTIASFNLTTLEATIIGSQENVGVTWYSNIGLTTAISSPYITGSTTVYAKVSNSSAASCYNSIAIALTVNRTTTVTSTSSTLCSTIPGGSTASFDLNSLESTIINGQSNVTVSWYSNIDLTTAISSPHITGSTTVYAKVSNSNATSCYSSVAVALTVNRTPTATSTGATLCSTSPAGTTASFDLTSLEATILNGQSNVSINWYSNAGLTTGVSSPYVTGTTTIYAKVVNTNAATCSNSIAIDLTVNSRPGIITADVTQPTCAVSTGTLTVTSSKVGLTFSLNSSNPADFTNSTGVFNMLAPGSYTIRSKSAVGCISDGVANEVLAAPGATPAADVIILSSPSCSSSTGTLKVVQAGSLAEYDNTIFEFNNGGEWTSNPVFSFKAGEGYSITVRRKADHTCFVNTACTGEAPVTEKSSEMNSTRQVGQEQQFINPPLQMGVKALPNPFADRVRFAVTTERSGNGSLDVYNMQGQKVKTVYSGFVPAGTSYYDLEITGQSTGQLVYVLRIGSEKLSGKLIRVNR